MNSESRVMTPPFQAELRWPRPVEKRATPGVHSCQCMCPRCEQAGAGFFAQLAALDGQADAAEHLGEAVYFFLKSAACPDHSQAEKSE